MHFSTFVAALAATATSVFAQADLAKTDKFFSATASYFKRETGRNSRAFVTEPRQLGLFLNQDPKLCTPTILIDTRNSKDFNGYKGHIKGATNLPALDSWLNAGPFINKLKTCQNLPNEISKKAIKKIQDKTKSEKVQIVFYGEDNSYRTAKAAAAVFNCLSSEFSKLSVAVMRDDYEKFARISGNKNLLVRTAGSGMSRLSKAKEAVKGWFGRSEVVPATNVARDLKAQRRAIVAAQRA